MSAQPEDSSSDESSVCSTDHLREYQRETDQMHLEQARTAFTAYRMAQRAAEDAKRLVEHTRGAYMRASSRSRIPKGIPLRMRGEDANWGYDAAVSEITDTGIYDPHIEEAVEAIDQPVAPIDVPIVVPLVVVPAADYTPYEFWGVELSWRKIPRDVMEIMYGYCSPYAEWKKTREEKLYKPVRLIPDPDTGRITRGEICSYDPHEFDSFNQQKDPDMVWVCIPNAAALEAGYRTYACLNLPEPDMLDAGRKVVRDYYGRPFPRTASDNRQYDKGVCSGNRRWMVLPDSLCNSADADAKYFSLVPEPQLFQKFGGYRTKVGDDPYFPQEKGWQNLIRLNYMRNAEDYHEAAIDRAVR